MNKIFLLGIAISVLGVTIFWFATSPRAGLITMFAGVVFCLSGFAKNVVRNRRY